ncbi:MAG: response regulator [Anaerolineae bacterium]|nr:response regulator [Anaerolineae bacterium]
MTKRILYIDDNPNDQRLVRKVLATRGYQLIIAGSGAEGIQQAQVSDPDLILVDIQMPGLNGLETVRLLRNVESCVHVPIVALTAYAEKYQRQTYIDAGFTDYQQKQAGIKPLLGLVQTHLG